MEDVDIEDEFQDALESQPVPCTMDLNTAMEEARTAVHYFFNNKFTEAKQLLEPWAESSMYHALGNCVFKFLEAMLTFEHQHIETAAEALKKCMAICHRHRKKVTISESIGKMVKRVNYDSYTPEEIHAELCYAESLLLKSMLTFMEDETLVSFIKAGLKIRSCYGSYKECNYILNNRNWNAENHKIHFESGVRMGIGAFNLMISLLPGRVIKLLEFIGFSGSKEVGLKELVTGYHLKNSLRQVLCVMVLLGYHLIVVYVLSHTDGDLEFCDDILRSQLQLYPNGAWFLLFKGRLEFMKGNIHECVDWYTKSVKSQNLWPQFHHLCYWELMWANAVQQSWREASEYAGYLVNGSKWSRTIYSYQRAVMMCMLGDELSPEDKQEIEALMRDAPQYKQRIAGKSLPMEKFVVKKCDRFFAQKKMLILPAFELLYVWNYFKVLGKKWTLVEEVFKIVEKVLVKIEQQKSEYYADNKGLVLLLKGACLRQMGSPLQAEECLRDVIALEKKIKEDNYLVPYAQVELALLLKDQGDKDRAAVLLEDTKKQYTSYSLESRLHFKIHSAQLELQGEKKAASEGSSSSSS